MTDPYRNARAEGSARPIGLLAVVLALGGFALSPLLRLELTGEDYSILARLSRGEVGSPHVFRPLADGALAMVHGVFGADSPMPFHALSLGLHLLVAALAFRLVRTLGLPSVAAGLGALLLVLGAGAMDAVAWASAVNRPLAMAGGLVALIGLARFDRSLGLGAPLVLLGLVWQLMANEEGLGTGLVCIVWLVHLAWKAGPGADRRSAAQLAGAVAALLAIWFLGFASVPATDAGAGLQSAPEQIASSISRRAGILAAGWGLPSATGLLLPVLGVALLLRAGQRREAGFLSLVWVGSLVPFALADAVGYRVYPTQVATALLLGAGLVAGWGLVVPAGIRRASAAACLVAALGIFLASSPARTGGITTWEAAVSEVAACRAALDAGAGLAGNEPPVLANLETSTAGLFLYRWPSATPESLGTVAFLDTTGAFVRPASPPPGPWFGLRCEGTVGWIDPDVYLDLRPALEPVRLYGKAHTVSDLAAARSLLASGTMDLRREAVVEAAPGSLSSLTGETGSMRVLTPLTFPQGSLGGSLMVAVSLEAPSLLAVQDPRLWSGKLRISPDQRLFSGVDEVRVVRASASIDNAPASPGHFLNAYGFGFLLPAGKHRVEVSFALAAPGDLREGR